MNRFLPVCAVAALLLAACDQSSPVAAPADDTRRAEGDVAGGTITDAMLPLDTVTSTPPAAKPTASETATGRATGTSSATAKTDAPAATPTPEAGAAAKAAPAPETE